MNVKSQHTGQVRTDRLEKRNRETLSGHLGMAAVVKEAKGQIELRLARNIKTQRKSDQGKHGPIAEQGRRFSGSSHKP